MNVTFEQLQDAMKRLGYQFFDSGDYNLNIVGIRAEDLDSNAFNDRICLAFYVAGQPVLLQFDATTDPGSVYRTDPINESGAAILCPGQHRNAFKLGMHQGKYRALVQAVSLPVYRDNDKNAFLDLSEKSIRRGWYGINLHRASYRMTSTQVDKWSAGCQVIASPSEFNVLVSICELAAEKWGNSFTYTLLNEHDLEVAK